MTWWGGTSAAFFGDEDTPVTWIVLDIEFLEDFIQDCSCGCTVADSHDSSLSILADEFSAILRLFFCARRGLYLTNVIDTHDPTAIDTGHRFLVI